MPDTQMERIARRAPGSADMRAALAALYYAQGRVEEAEGQWWVFKPYRQFEAS
jgi:thioredoxin-like negative regulator of GroEL